METLGIIQIMQLLPDVTVILIFLMLIMATRYFYNTGLYWFRKRVPGPIPLPYIGNYLPRWMSTTNIIDYDHKYYSDYGGKRYCGFFEFQKKTFMVGDLELLNHILVKDFNNFVNRRKASIGGSVLDKTVFALEGSLWKSMRTILEPIFSSENVEQMTPVVLEVSNRLPALIFKDTKERKSEQELCSLFRTFAIEVVSTVVFGMEFNALNQNNQNEFRTSAKKVLDSLSRRKRFESYFSQQFPTLAKLFRFPQRDESVATFFQKIITDALAFRRSHGNKRTDFLDLLEAARKKMSKENNEGDDETSTVLTKDALVAQCVMFFTAGTDTVATTLALFFHSLIFHSEVQDRLITEIDSVLNSHGGKITYASLQKMTYLDMVLKETERMFPPSLRMNRVTEKEYKLPGTDVTLEANTRIIIPVRSIHYDPEYYINPTAFDPERFSPEMEGKRHPLCFLTFGHGPRNCLGMKFATLEMKACIVSLLKEVRVSSSSKTQTQLQQDKAAGVLKISGGIWCLLTKRKENLID